MKTRNLTDTGMLDRLMDQRKVMRASQEIHANPRLLDEIAFYPAHDKRRETPEYKAVHRKMVIKEDLPCLICGVKNSTLNDKKKNLYGAKQLETHHHVVEWALANAIDVDKFNKILLPHLRFQHKDVPEYQKDFNAQQVKDWVDHSEHNLWVLCDVHHRAKYVGIHEITFPIWGPQDLLRDDFEEYVNSEIAKVIDENAKGEKKKNGRKISVTH